LFKSVTVGLYLTVLNTQFLGLNVTINENCKLDESEAETPRHVTSEEFDFRYSFAAEELSRIPACRQKLCSILMTVTGRLTFTLYSPVSILTCLLLVDVGL